MRLPFLPIALAFCSCPLKAAPVYTADSVSFGYSITYLVGDLVGSIRFTGSDLDITGYPFYGHGYFASGNLGDTLNVTFPLFMIDLSGPNAFGTAGGVSYPFLSLGLMTSATVSSGPFTLDGRTDYLIPTTISGVVQVCSGSSIICTDAFTIDFSTSGILDLIAIGGKYDPTPLTIAGANFTSSSVPEPQTIWLMPAVLAVILLLPRPSARSTRTTPQSDSV